MSGASGQISSSSRQGGGREAAEVAVGEPDVSAAAEAKSHSASLSRALETALLRCLRAREAARAGDGDIDKGEIADIMIMRFRRGCGMRDGFEVGGVRDGTGCRTGWRSNVNKYLSFPHRYPSLSGATRDSDTGQSGHSRNALPDAWCMMSQIHALREAADEVGGINLAELRGNKSSDVPQIYHLRT